MHPPLDRWSPLSPDDVGEVFAGWPRPWWIAGGYAVELAVGRPLRPHGDIDVLVLRGDHESLHAVLAHWQLWAADPPGSLRPWPRGEVLLAQVHDVWCLRPSSDAWELQIMIDESAGSEWVSRRDSRVRAPLDAIGARSAHGLPFLAPQIQLFYKSKGMRPKDEVDFAAALPLLTADQRDWLDHALSLTSPDHPWRGLL